MTSLFARTALIGLILPAAGGALAQTPPPSSPAPAAASAAGDENRMGGTMTLAQFQTRQESRTMAADTDGDGRVSLAEWTAQASGRRGGGAGGGGYDPARAFARMDANHDGFLDKTEIDAAAAERFRRMDANGDGVVSPDERMAGRGGMHRRGDRPMPPDGGAVPPPPTPQP